MKRCASKRADGPARLNAGGDRSPQQTHHRVGDNPADQVGTVVRGPTCAYRSLKLLNLFNSAVAYHPTVSSAPPSATPKAALPTCSGSAPSHTKSYRGAVVARAPGEGLAAFLFIRFLQQGSHAGTRRVVVVGQGDHQALQEFGDHRLLRCCVMSAPTDPCISAGPWVSANLLPLEGVAPDAALGRDAYRGSLLPASRSGRCRAALFDRSTVSANHQQARDHRPHAD